MSLHLVKEKLLGDIYYTYHIALCNVCMISPAGEIL